MASKLYVGNLPFKFEDADLSGLFEEFGEIVSAVIIKDKFSGRSKGFGFVEFGTDEAAQAAIKAMSGKEVEGRALVVDEARPPRTDGGGGGRF